MQLLLSQEGFRFRGQGRALPFRLPSGQYEIKKEIQCQCVLVVVSITDALISATSCMNAEKALSDHTLEQDRLSSASPDLDGGGGAHEDTKSVGVRTKLVTH